MGEEWYHFIVKITGEQSMEVDVYPLVDRNFRQNKQAHLLVSVLYEMKVAV